MTQGSEDKPAKREKSFDAAWGELLDDAAKGAASDDEAARESGPKGTQFGDASELARKAAEARADADSDAAEQEGEGEGPQGTLLGTPAKLAAQAREAQARDAMDWMMTVSPEASGFGRVVVPESDGPAAVSGEHPIVASDSVVSKKVVVEASKASPDKKKVAPTKKADDKVAAKKGIATDAELGAGKPAVRRLDHAIKSGRAANERPAESGGSGSGRIIMAVAAIGVIGALAWAVLQGGDDTSPKSAARAQAAVDQRGKAMPSDTPPPRVEPTPTRTSGRDDPAPEPDDRPLDAVDSDDAQDDASEDPLDDPPDDEPTTPATGDIREPPPGTPEENAAAFRKLPVSPADRAPVGGVGPNGIHLDHISMGTKYEDGRCQGEARKFSLSAGDRPSVCVRVVHPREKEELVLLWEKKDGATRRGKLIIPNGHAYRTRAYLVLRREYVGEWTVRVQSPDGTDLATYEFTVQP